MIYKRKKRGALMNYKILNDDDLEKIHEQSLKILENVGIRVDYPPAQDLLKKHGAKLNGNIVTLPRQIVLDALKKTPSGFTLYARNPENNVEINRHNMVCNGSYGPAFISEGKEFRPSTLADMINLTKLHQQSNAIDVISHIPCEANDTDSRTRHGATMIQQFLYSDKPLMGSILGERAAENCIDIAAIVFGGREEIVDKPVMISVPGAISPLHYDNNMSGSIMAYAKAGQAQLISTCCMAGATSPVTLAGTLAVENAEILGGIVLAQSAKEGAPLVYAASSSNIDMRYGCLAIASPENSLLALATGQLAAMYDLPCRISGALSDSKCLDAQAAMESGMSMLMSFFGNGNYIMHAAGILDGYNAVSFEKFIIDEEIVQWVKRLREGITLNTETLAYDLIAQCGPGGQYFDKQHTFDYCRREFFLPDISERRNYFQWREGGSFSIEEKAKKKWRERLESYEQPYIPKETVKSMEAYLKKM